MRRLRGGTKTPHSVSVSVSRSTTTRPRSGRISPAMTLISDVLPDPERPNSAVSPPSASNAASRRKAPRRWRTATSIISMPEGAAGGALDDPLRQKQRRRRDRDRDQGETQRADLAAGNLRQRIDRGRQGLCLAGDVRDEGDRRAELAERAGKGQDHPRKDPRKDQRQGHGQEYPDRAGAQRAGGVFEAAVHRVERQPDRAHH